MGLHIDRDPKLRAAWDLLDALVDEWVISSNATGVDRAHCIGLIGEQLAMRLGFHIASARMQGDEHVDKETAKMGYDAVAREFAIATRLCMLQQGERPIELVRAEIAKRDRPGSSAAFGARWALDEFERLTNKFADA